MAVKKQPAFKHTPAEKPEPRLFTVKGAANYLSATVWFVRNLAWTKAVPYITLGQRMLFDKKDLDEYIESRKAAA